MSFKFLKICLILFVAFSLLSCDKDDDKTDNSGKTPKELLIGNWKLEKAYDFEGNDVTDECTILTSMEFFLDNTLKWYSYEKIGGNCIEIFFHESNIVTYRIEANKLHIKLVSHYNSAENELTFTISEISETKLILQLTSDHRGITYKRTN